MNEELSNKLQETLIGLIDSTTSAAEFVQSEIPEVLEQLLMWKMGEGIFFICLGLFFALITYLLRKPTVKGWNDDYESGDADTAWAELRTIGLIWFSIVSVIIIAISTLTVLKIWLAPKVYLIEYAASLIK